GDLFENNTQTGGGLGVQIGYGVSRLVTIYLGIDGAVIDTDEIENAYTLAHVDAGVHLNFGGPRSATIPYLNLAFTFRQATVEVGPVEVDFTGGGVTGGGGLKFFLSRTVALDLGAAATIGTFSEVEAGTLREEIDVGAVSGRLMLGVSLFPSR
ncbi:MAG: outer membrane beta-barrel protein, partial [Rhodothermales bacterium]